MLPKNVITQILKSQKFIWFYSYSSHNDCCPDYNDICNDINDEVTDEELKSISNQLFELAIQKQVGIVLDLQGLVHSGSPQDNAPKKYVKIFCCTVGEI